MKTVLTIENEKFLINGKLTYSEIENCNKKYQGLLMNCRFIQGIFDDKENVSRFNRFGINFDPEKNTMDLIDSLKEWYSYGLRAFTVGLQGGGPCFTIANETINNNPYSEDGMKIDEKYLSRLKKILDYADEIGMVVIVSLIYAGQVKRLNGAQAVINVVHNMSTWLKNGGWKNIILEVANEYTIGKFKEFPIINTAQGMVSLMDIAKRESGLPVGCSGGGGDLEKEVAMASDVILIHGNGQTRQDMVKLINKARRFSSGKPIVCNEDSQAIGNMLVCMDNGVSWGYYNDMTKQEPPTNWNVLDGEDKCMALRMAEKLGIVCDLPKDEIELVGISKNECFEGKCWPRIATLYPEKIDYVEYFYNDEKIFTCYDEPYSLYFDSNWYQQPFKNDSGKLSVSIIMTDGRVVSVEKEIGSK